MTSQLFCTVCMVLMTLFAPPLSSCWPCATFQGRIHIFECKNANCFDISIALTFCVLWEVPQSWKPHDHGSAPLLWLHNCGSTHLWLHNCGRGAASTIMLHVPCSGAKNCNLCSHTQKHKFGCTSVVAPMWLHDHGATFPVPGPKPAICVFTHKNANLVEPLSRLHDCGRNLLHIPCSKAKNCNLGFSAQRHKFH